jgi:hypothetical protein
MTGTLPTLWVWLSGQARLEEPNDKSRRLTGRSDDGDPGHGFLLDSAGTTTVPPILHVTTAGRYPPGRSSGLDLV